jgi:hypothetical protein
MGRGNPVTPIRFFDFSGGLNTTSPVTSLQQNQALDLQNINLLPTGGFEKRRGNTAFNSSEMDSGASVHGTGYYRQSDSDEWLMAIAGSKIFKSEFDGTMDDITGAVTITAGNNNIWINAQMNDISIWVGGNRTSDVPIKWSGSGNAAALGGSPPVGEFGIAANNRFFIGSTVANPSRIAWTVFGDPEDWSGTGSGVQDVQKNDGDTLVGAALSGIDHLLLFKQNSIHDLAIRNTPFPLFPLFRNVGAVSKRGIVNVDGIIYFITPQARMKATDGTKIIDFPSVLDDTWDSLNQSRLQYLHGLYNKKLRQIWWFVSSESASTHDLCIIWDIERKAWLLHRTGYKMNTAIIAQDRIPYCGAYDGKLYKMDVASTYTDASESAGTISAYWRSGWMDFQNMIQEKGVLYVDLNFSTQSTGTFEFAHGFDFSQDRKFRLSICWRRVVCMAPPFMGSMSMAALLTILNFCSSREKESSFNFLSEIKIQGKACLLTDSKFRLRRPPPMR